MPRIYEAHSGRDGRGNREWAALRWTARSGFEEPFDGLSSFGDFGCAFGTTGGYGVGDTVVKVVFEESNGNALEGFGY